MEAVCRAGRARWRAAVRPPARVAGGERGGSRPDGLLRSVRRCRIGRRDPARRWARPAGAGRGLRGPRGRTLATCIRADVGSPAGEHELRGRPASTVDAGRWWTLPSARSRRHDGAASADRRRPRPTLGRRMEAAHARVARRGRPAASAAPWPARASARGFRSAIGGRPRRRRLPRARADLQRHPAHRAQAPRQLHRGDPPVRRGPGPRRPGDLLHRRPARDDASPTTPPSCAAHVSTRRRC